MSTAVPVPRHLAGGAGPAMLPLRPAGMLTVSTYLVAGTTARGLNRATMAARGAAASTRLQCRARRRAACRELARRRLVTKLLQRPGATDATSAAMACPTQMTHTRRGAVDGARTPPRICVLVVAARGLQDLSGFLSTQDPYARVTLLPEGAEMAAMGLDAFPFDAAREGLGTARTAAVDGGGVAPRFGGAGGAAFARGGCAMLVRGGCESSNEFEGGGAGMLGEQAGRFEALSADDLRRATATGVLMELWDESMGGDQLIANAVLPMPPDSGGAPVQLSWVGVKPQGEVLVAVFEA